MKCYGSLLFNVKIKNVIGIRENFILINCSIYDYSFVFVGYMNFIVMWKRSYFVVLFNSLGKEYI